MNDVDDTIAHCKWSLHPEMDLAPRKLNIWKVLALFLVGGRRGNVIEDVQAGCDGGVVDGGEFDCHLDKSNMVNLSVVPESIFVVV